MHLLSRNRWTSEAWGRAVTLCPPFNVPQLASSGHCTQTDLMVQNIVKRAVVMQHKSAAISFPQLHQPR